MIFGINDFYDTVMKNTFWMVGRLILFGW